jgi:hypothetical protein
MIAVVEGEKGHYQVQTTSSSDFVVGLVVQLETALEMPGLQQQQQAVLDCIKAFDVGRLKAQIVLRGKF